MVDFLEFLCTTEGKMFFCLYAIIGIAPNFVLLQAIATYVNNSLEKIFYKVRKRYNLYRRRHMKSEFKKDYRKNNELNKNQQLL